MPEWFRAGPLACAPQPGHSRSSADRPALAGGTRLRRVLLLLGALACTVTETIPTDEPPSEEPTEPGEEPGEEPGASGSGSGGGGTDGMGGAGGSGMEPPRSDVIDVNDGEFTPGETPPTAGDAQLSQIVSIVGPPAVTNGGSAILHVQLSPPVPEPRFVVGLDEDSGGYHTVTGVDPDGDGTYDITTVVAAGATQTSLTFRVALTDGAGNVGPYSQLTVPVIQSGTGDVKITLSWDRLHDLDLHVMEPSGEVIRYSNQASGTGGALDLDSGANCAPSPANSENIFWPSGGAPTGQYVVSVHNYQQCTPGPIEYTVRVVYDNVVNTYRGTFAEGTASEMETADNLHEIVRFTR